MKRKSSQADRSAAIVAAVPGASRLQRDCAKKPINIGDRIEDTECHGGGIVTSVFGNALIYLCDYHHGDHDMGSFVYGRCDAVRVLPPVTDVPAAIRELLARKKKLDTIQAKLAKTEAPSASSACTRIEPEKCVDQNGRRVEIGDSVYDPSNDFGGTVVAIAGIAVMFRQADGSFDGTFARQCISHSPAELLHKVRSHETSKHFSGTRKMKLNASRDNGKV